MYWVTHDQKQTKDNLLSKKRRGLPVVFLEWQQNVPKQFETLVIIK